MQTKLKLLAVFLFTVLSFKSKAQYLTIPPCGIPFQDNIECGIDIDINWQYYSGGSVCSTGSASGVTGTIPLTCSCAPTVDDLRITITAIGGCSVTPTSLLWSNCVTPLYKLIVLIPCPINCLPAIPICCDNGTALILKLTSSGGYSFSVN